MGGSAGPLRGAKGNTYEGGMRVPAIFWQPTRIAAGKTVATVASVLDILPTAAHLAGASLPKDRVIDGQSLHTILYSASPPAPERLFCYYFGGQLQAVRRGKWKLILPIHELPPRPPSLWYELMPALFARHYRLKKEPELYDLTSDIAERDNLAAQHPGIVRDLTQAAARFDHELQANKRPMVFVD